MTNKFKQTDIGLIPEDWGVSKLGELVSFKKGIKPKLLSESYSQEFNIPYLTAKYFRENIIVAYTTKVKNNRFVEATEKEVILIWDGSNAGDVFIGLNGALASTMVKFVNIKELTNYHLYYFLKTKFEELNSKTTGSTIPHVSRNVLNNIDVPIPPLPEQKKIAHVLSKIQQAIETQEKIIKTTQELKKALMQKLFTEGLYDEPQKQTEIGPIPESWDVVKLKSLVEIMDYGTSKRCDYNIKGLPVIRIPNIIKGVVDLTDLKYGSFTEKEIKSNLLKEGDVLFVRTNGQKVLTGRSAVVEAMTNPFLFASYLIRVRLNENIIPYYLNYFAYTELGKSMLSGKSIRTADGKFNINKGVLFEFQISLPSIDVQKEIVRYLRKVDEKIILDTNKINLMKEFFAHTLNKLMTGKIRVKDIEFDIEKNKVS